MKKLLVASLLISLSASVSAHVDKLSSAIKKQDLDKMTELAPHVKEIKVGDAQKLLKEAKDKISEASENVSLSKSPWDLAKFAGGTTFVIFGSLAAYGGVLISDYLKSGKRDLNMELTLPADIQLMNNAQRRQMGEFYKNVAIGSGIVAAIGAYFAIKGYMCSAAQAKVDKARAILDVLKKASEKIEENKTESK